MPSVTVLMPVYNGERYLRAAVESILAQTHHDFEFLIMNDGSTDRSREIVISYGDPRIRVIDNETNLGLTRTLNKGLRLASHGLIARQDADDLSCPDRLEKQIAFLLENPDVVLVGTQGVIIDQDGKPRSQLLDRGCRHDSIRWDLLFDNGFTHTSVMFRKDIVVDEFKGYDESFAYCQDYDLWSRISHRHPVANLPMRLVQYRVHPFSRMSELMRVAMPDESRRVARSNADALFGAQGISDDEIGLIVDLRLRFRRELLVPFFRLLTRLIEDYQRLNPGIETSLDFREVVARRYARVAHKVWRSDPGSVWRVYAESIRRYPIMRVTLVWLCDFMRKAFLRFFMRGHAQVVAV